MANHQDSHSQREEWPRGARWPSSTTSRWYHGCCSHFCRLASSMGLLLDDRCSSLRLQILDEIYGRFSIKRHSVLYSDSRRCRGGAAVITVAVSERCFLRCLHMTMSCRMTKYVGLRGIPESRPASILHSGELFPLEILHGQVQRMSENYLQCTY